MAPHNQRVLRGLCPNRANRPTHQRLTPGQSCVSPALSPPLRLASARLLASPALGKMSWREIFSGELTLLFRGRCNNSKQCWNPEAACFSGILLELAENLDVLAPAQPSLHEGRGTVCSGWVPHPLAPHSHDKPEHGGHIPKLSSQTC